MFLLGKRSQFPCLLRLRAERLLANHIFPCQQRFFCLFIMKKVRRCHINHVDFLVLQKLIQIRIYFIGTILCRQLFPLLFRSRIHRRKPDSIRNRHIIEYRMYNGTRTNRAQSDFFHSVSFYSLISLFSWFFFRFFIA